ncbi:uncharacterized protein LOC129806216 [Phlebotomus papatasi]|uniref:uncharacterized protein LOC129806216 n=1 Tax=Phlebotomus papatasi TaxID=29031 RepID=UPI0024835569|nr:uncharacterized protein LOC129806216 [Phlebotomus papatasi]
MGKFNEEQLRTALDFMKRHPVMLQKRNKMNNKSRMSLWKDLVDKLNNHGPPYKSEIGWRRSWAKKKFEMTRVQKRRVSVYEDLDNLLARASEMSKSADSQEYSEAEDSEEDHDTTDVDPLQVRKRDSKVLTYGRQSNPEVKHRNLPKVEVIETSYESNPNGTSSHDRSLVRNSHRNSRPTEVSNPTNSCPPEYSSSPSPHEIVESSSRRQKSSRSSPENSVELFFKSLAIEVNRANLPSDRLFNLELCVMKLVSEKIQEYERAEAQMRH